MLDRIPAVRANGDLSADAVTIGDTVYTTAIPTGADGALVGNDVTAQARVAFDNLRTALVAAGSDLEHIAHLTIHLVDIARDRAAFNAVYAEYFPGAVPVRCAVGVAALARPEMLVELTAIAARAA